MFTIVKMQTRSILRNPAAIFILIFPIIFVSVLTSVAVSNYGDVDKLNLALGMLFSNIIVLTILTTVNNTFGSNFMELKRTVIIKRLGSTQISKAEAMGGFLIWAVILAAVQTLYIMFLFWFVQLIGVLPEGATFFSDKIDVLSVIYGLIILIVLSFSMVFFFMSLSSSSEIYQVMAFFYFFLVLYFGGLIFTVNIQWMNIVSLFLPHTYIAHFLNGAFNGGTYLVGPNVLPEIGSAPSIWDFTNYSDTYILNGISSLNVLMPIVFATLFGYVGIKNFNWDS